MIWFGGRFGDPYGSRFGGPYGDGLEIFRYGMIQVRVRCTGFLRTGYFNRAYMIRLATLAAKTANDGKSASGSDYFRLKHSLVAFLPPRSRSGLREHTYYPNDLGLAGGSKFIFFIWRVLVRAIWAH